MTQRTALTILEEEKLHRRLPTFAKSLDELLGGGVRPGPGILEVCGAPGSGKTQLCLQLCINAQIPVEFGGFGRQAVYIDSEGSFMAERLVQMARGLSMHLHKLANYRNSDELKSIAAALTVRKQLENVFVFRVFDHLELSATILHLEKILPTLGSDTQAVATTANSRHSSVGVVIVDSICFPFRHAFADTSYTHGARGIKAAERNSHLLNTANALNLLAHKYNLAVIVTNQMTTKILRNEANDSTSVLEPSLGPTWAHVPNLRVQLEMCVEHEYKRTAAETVRKAILLKCNTRPKGAVYFQLREEGIRDLPQAAATATETKNQS